MSCMRSVAVIVTFAKRWRKLATASARTGHFKKRPAKSTRSKVQADTLAESVGGQQFGELEDPHKNCYVCLKCRANMANEAFVSCHHQMAYCSECISTIECCPWCNQDGARGNQRARS